MEEKEEQFRLGFIPSEKVFDTPFSEQLIFNIEQFNYRMTRLASINTFDASNQAEYLMVFDAAMVLFRSLFLEKGKNNYTIQNYYRLTGREDAADAIDGFLDSDIDSWSGLSIRKLLKTIADKFICHIDSVDYTTLGNVNAYMAKLSNPGFDNNFQNIVERLNEIIKEYHNK